MSEDYKYTNLKPDLRATIYYLTEKEGGRKSWIASGYRGQFYYDNENWLASQTFIEKDKCQPGESIDCYLTTADPQRHSKRLFVGKTFEIREGTIIVGKGIITEVLNAKFLCKK